MKKKVFKGLCLLCFLLAGFLFSGCRKDLCYDHDAHRLVDVLVSPFWECVWERDFGMNWQENWPDDFGLPYDSLRPVPSSGLAMFIYEEGNTFLERHLPAEGGSVRMKVGMKSFLFCNDDTRYILFSGMDSLSTASIRTRQKIRSSYAKGHKGEVTVGEPDMLFVDWRDTCMVKPESNVYGLSAKMEPVVYSYLIRYVFEQGQQYVVLSRGALSGMAGSVYLREARTGSDRVTVLFDGMQKDFGVEARVRTFGIPDFGASDVDVLEGKEDMRFGLNLEVMLSNGKTKIFDFDVTEQLLEQPFGGVVEVSGLVVTDDEAGGGSGFDVEVDGWGKEADIELPLE